MVRSPWIVAVAARRTCAVNHCRSLSLCQSSNECAAPFRVYRAGRSLAGERQHIFAWRFALRSRYVQSLRRLPPRRMSRMKVPDTVDDVPQKLPANCAEEVWMTS